MKAKRNKSGEALAKQIHGKVLIKPVDPRFKDGHLHQFIAYYNPQQNIWTTKGVNPPPHLITYKDRLKILDYRQYKHRHFVKLLADMKIYCPSNEELLIVNLK